MLKSSVYFLSKLFRKKAMLLFLFGLIIISPKTAAAANHDKEINNLVALGLSQAYNFNWEKANSTFTKIIETYPDDPRGFYYKSIVYQWYFLGSGDKADYQNFLNLSDSVIEKASVLVEKKPDDIKMLYMLGAVYACRGIVFTKAESYLNAAWAVKKSESFLSSVISMDSLYYDAYLGLGLYNFAIGQIPDAFNWALSLAGIEGSRSEGINYIELAANKGKFAKVEAQYYLSMIFTEVLIDYKQASFYLRNLVERFPENIIFNYSYACLEIKERNLNKAKKILQNILAKSNPKFNQIIALSGFLMGDVFYRKNEFDKAEKFYLDFLTFSNDNDYKGIASLRLAICYEITGDSILAEEYFSQCDQGNMDLDDDVYAKRKAEIYSEEIDSVQIKVIKANNMIYAGKYQAAYDSLYQLLPVIQKNDLKAETYLYLSQASYELGNYDESLRMAFAAQSAELETELWVRPFAVYYIAMSYKKLGNDVAFKNFIEEAEDYEGYDYQNKLQNLIMSAKIFSSGSLMKDSLNSAKNLN